MTAEDQGRQESTPRRSKKKKAKVKTDLAVVKSANNPYPVYQMFLKSDRFSVEELLTAFEHLSRADLRIKTGSENKKLILEELVFNICRAP
jgi:DNA polymerase-3 subunit delta